MGTMQSKQAVYASLFVGMLWRENVCCYLGDGKTAIESKGRGMLLWNYNCQNSVVVVDEYESEVKG
jgi:hypothetical protein